MVCEVSDPSHHSLSHPSSLSQAEDYQALVRALFNDHGKELFPNPEDKEALDAVKGVIFFGMPFRGSRWANILAPLIWIKSGTSPLIKSLQIRNFEVEAVTDKFKQIANGKNSEVQLICCSESKPPLGLGFLSFVSFRIRFADYLCSRH